MPNPTIDIILPNYDHAAYIATAITALTRDMGPDDRLRVIDDCSSDNSIEVIEGFAAHDARIELIRNPKNRGVIYSMNLGLECATAPLIYFAAADDEILPGFLTRCRAMLTDHPDAALAIAMTRTMDETGQDTGLLPTAKLTESAAYVAPPAVKTALMRDDTWISGNATIYRRDVLIAAGGFQDRLGAFTDGFASRLLACRYGACFIPEDLCRWRRLETAYSHTGNIDRTRRDAVKAEALRLMREDYADIFPNGYDRRWEGRWEYGARSLVLRTAQPEASRITRAAKQAMLFARYRPKDAGAVLRRWLYVLLRRGLTAPKHP